MESKSARTVRTSFQSKKRKRFSELARTRVLKYRPTAEAHSPPIMEAGESASGKSEVVSYASTSGTPTSRPVKGGVSCLSSVETVSESQCWEGASTAMQAASLLSSHSEDSEPESAPSFVEPLLSDSVDSKTESGSQGLEGTSTDIHEASFLCSSEESESENDSYAELLFSDSLDSKSSSIEELSSECGSNHGPTSTGIHEASPLCNSEEGESENDELLLSDSLDGKSSSIEELSSECESDHGPSYHGIDTPTKKKLKLATVDSLPELSGHHNRLFVSETCQLQSLIESFNATSKCSVTEGCNGMLVPVHIKTVGLGGAIEIIFACNGCWGRRIPFRSSALIEGTKRSVVSVAIQVAFIAAGCTHSTYLKVLKQSLGMSAVTGEVFSATIKLLYPVVQEIMSNMCEEAKEELRAIPDYDIGSWKRAVTTADGTWLTRGYFSKNHTFTVRNYLTGALLYTVHLCMRGSDDADEELYQGTAKAAEGIAASRAFSQAKADGMHIEVQWQDGDSSSALSFRESYPSESTSHVMLCGGHVARCFAKVLKDLASKKKFSEKYKSMHRERFPDVDSVVCKCKRHSKGCGCMSASFLAQARVNFFCCLVQAGTNPEAFARRLRNLGKYHARDIHEWTDEEGEARSCDFHDLVSCTCGKCGDEIHCEGKQYKTRNPLHCPFHALAFEIECDNRASQATELIHPELGRGHSNLPEASHNVLIRFRSKNLNLQRLHYIVSTNLGLLQSNMTWLLKKRGITYHWLLELFTQLKLPIFEGMSDALVKVNKERVKRLERIKTTTAKHRRVVLKQAKREDHEARKHWVKSQAIQHDYGDDDSSDDEPSTNDPEADRLLSSADCVASVDGIVVTSAVGRCKCGSVTHKRTNHSDCPLNKCSRAEVQHSTSAINEPDAVRTCKCGSHTHQRTTHHSCPLNKHHTAAL